MLSLIRAFENPAISIRSFGNIVQKPIKNIRAEINTDGIYAFVLIEIMSPIAIIKRITVKAAKICI